MKQVYSIVALSLMLGVFAVAWGEPTVTRGNLGLGFQAGTFTTGLSGKYSMTKNLTIQGVVGIFGDDSYYGGRLLFEKRYRNHRPYLFGTVGGKIHKRDDYVQTSSNPDQYTTKTTREYSQAYGAGFGLEWFFPTFPQLGINLETGLVNYNEPPGTDDYATVFIGAGIHYYLSLDK